VIKATNSRGLTKSVSDRQNKVQRYQAFLASGCFWQPQMT
jgi:hypothetical protein